MPPNIAFTLLSSRPREIRRVAGWWCDEWGVPTRHASFEDYVLELTTLTNEEFPSHLLAERAGRAVGVATLKVKTEDARIAGHSYWLSGVYVEPAARKGGVATALCQEVVNFARRRGLSRLFLETERLDGGLYARLGWTPIQTEHDGGVVLVTMVKDLSIDAGA